MMPEFRWTPLFDDDPAERVLCVVGDVDGDGEDEIVIGCRRPEYGLYWLDRQPGGEWVKHMMDTGYPSLDAGGVLFDVDGDGRLDFIAGADGRTNHVSWWRCPADPTRPWPRTTIAELPGPQSHDQIVADLDGDGRAEVYFWNQGARTLFAAPIPDDPTVSPWPTVHPVAEGMAQREEGFAIADVDGDGRDELIAGQSWYRVLGGGRYECHPFAEGFVSPRLTAADFDGDGRIEIAIAEGDASFAKPGPATVAVLHRPDDPTALWQPRVLRTDLVDPHSLLAHDFSGDGRAELFVGELGSPNGNNPTPPTQRLYKWVPGGMTEHIVDRGPATHESKLIRLDGRVGIVAKAYRNFKAKTAPREPWVDTIAAWLPVD